MKRNFSQSFKRKGAVMAYLLVETAPGEFLQLKDTEDSTLVYYNVLFMEIDERADLALQLARFLHENGLALEEFYELTREHLVAYSFADKTPGSVEINVCLYVRATKTVEWMERSGDIEALIVPLEILLENFADSPTAYSVVNRAAAVLLAQQNILKML